MRAKAYHMSAQIRIYCGVVQNTLNCCYFDFIISEALLKHEIDKVMSQYCKHYFAHFMVDIHFIEGKNVPNCGAIFVSLFSAFVIVFVYVVFVYKPVHHRK